MDHIIAIPTKVAELVRQTMKSPGYGHTAHAELATGYGPCRHCLQLFEFGPGASKPDQRILFTYDPFHGLDRPLPGPVFIHAEVCIRYPEDAGFPTPLAAHPLTIKAYAGERKLLRHIYLSASVGEDGHASVIDQLFQDPETKYLLVYDTDAGCYDFRIERHPELVP